MSWYSWWLVSISLLVWAAVKIIYANSNNNPLSFYFFRETCSPPGWFHMHTNSEDKQTPPPDCNTHSISSWDKPTHTQAELYTAYRAPSVSGDAQTDERWWASPRGDVIRQQGQGDFSQPALARLSPTTSHHGQQQWHRGWSQLRHCGRSHWSACGPTLRCLLKKKRRRRSYRCPIAFVNRLESLTPCLL